MDDGSLRYIPEPPQVLLLDAPHPWYKRLFNGLKGKNAGRAWFVVCVAIILVASLYQLFLGAPARFPSDSVLSIASGETLSGVTQLLEGRNAIRSPFMFKTFMVLFGGSRGLKAGDYYLENRQSVITIAWRITHSDYGLKNIKVTIPEGWSSIEIADFISKDARFAHFDPVQFKKIAAQYEGYLFPDTYLFLPTVSAQAVLDVMLGNYESRIQNLSADIKSFGRPIKDVIIMASIIEEEARTEETRRTIAGILWKRLDQGMPLQVDAAFAFVNGKKASADLTLADLQIDSPYNTYVHKGLPPGPISNPGLDAISATVRPIATKYYFYLSDKEGNMHYAVTNAEHEANKAKYLGN